MVVEWSPTRGTAPFLRSCQRRTRRRCTYAATHCRCGTPSVATAASLASDEDNNNHHDRRLHSAVQHGESSSSSARRRPTSLGHGQYQQPRAGTPARTPRCPSRNSNFHSQAGTPRRSWAARTIKHLTGTVLPVRFRRRRCLCLQRLQYSVEATPPARTHSLLHNHAQLLPPSLTPHRTPISFHHREHRRSMCGWAKIYSQRLRPPPPRGAPPEGTPCTHDPGLRG